MERNRLEVLLEEINSKVQLIIESNASLLADMQAMRTELNEKIDMVSLALDRVNNRLAAITA